MSVLRANMRKPATIKAAEIIELALKEIALIQDQSDRADLLAEVSIPWMRANIESNAERKLILNKPSVPNSGLNGHNSDTTITARVG